MNSKFVSRMELGLQNVTVTSLGRAALALKVPMSELLVGIEADRELLQVKPRANARPARTRVVPSPASDGAD